MKMIKIAVFALFFLVISSHAHRAHALFDPLTRTNNFYGIHVLFPEEIQEAVELVNSSGGSWGYITVPIQMTDFNLEKWQKFMDEAGKNKLIPIVRLTTEPYWNNTNVWRKPTQTDIIDMANFLNSLVWPVENRYIIVFNEMNRFDEWNGEAPNPEEYADLLSYAVDVFKYRNPNFYVIMGGLDNAAPNEGAKYMDNFTYLERMARHNPDAFRKMDGFSSHSYPNPGFSQPPNDSKRMGTATYKYEYEFIKNVAGSPKPAFITETGWDIRAVPEGTIAEYYQRAFDAWGKDQDKIVAITPFLLRSHGGFDEFSFIREGKKTKYYETFRSRAKVGGDPVVVNQQIGGISTALDLKPLPNTEEDESVTLSKKNISPPLKFYFRTILGMD